MAALPQGHSVVPFVMQNNAESNLYPTMVKQERHGHEATFMGENFPEDPRQWSCQDVRNWLDWMGITYNIRNIDVLKFHMNGKALCLMTLDMFLYRVPTGGNLLYHDFQSRLQRTVHGDR
ncbi:transcription factor ETV6-like [Dendronephthya gigantea]|uniref:transcription factor ETV6-like n=1 Tax=Dendronephthya gigantea TaxID=151771 RepID=UPI0010699F0E|nr:transcription factor ETV6-like [Dendronephthya gigantea]